MKRRAKGATKASPKAAPRGKPKAGPGAKSPARSQAVTGALVLVTGFEPFGGERTNPSWEACRRLPAAIGPTRIETLEVPCEFRRAVETVAAAIERLRPAVVICVGQAGGRVHLAIERVAINVDDARIADNAGDRPVDEPIVAGGPAAYFSTVPVKAMARAVRDAGIPAEVSNSAGTYVCNHLLYGVLHHLATSGLSARAGFIHVPYAETQVLERPGVPAMSVASMARALEVAIGACLEYAVDIRNPEGSEW